LINVGWNPKPVLKLINVVMHDVDNPDENKVGPTIYNIVKVCSVHLTGVFSGWNYKSNN
jgi:hypothetical protein